MVLGFVSDVVSDGSPASLHQSGRQQLITKTTNQSCRVLYCTIERASSDDVFDNVFTITTRRSIHTSNIRNGDQENKQ